MVTHDVSLKWFADRVIWLRDGKIQRIEIVPFEKKKECREKLERQLEALPLLCCYMPFAVLWMRRCSVG